jgi:hypothetical protein
MTHPIAGADPLPDRPPGPDALLAELTAEQRTAVPMEPGRCCCWPDLAPARPTP